MRGGRGKECEADEEEEEMMISFLPSFHSLTDALDFPSTAQVMPQKCHPATMASWRFGCQLPPAKSRKPLAQDRP
jgi:hypothetical protein